MRRPQLSLKTLMWLMIVVAAYCAGRMHGRYDFDSYWQENEVQHEKNRAHQFKILTELVAENLELRDRLGLPPAPLPGQPNLPLRE